MHDHPHPTVIVTGASSGVGLYAAKSLADRGWFVVMACRDLDKAAQAARALAIDPAHHELMHIDLGSQQSVRDFAAAFLARDVPLHALVNNTLARGLRDQRGHQPPWPLPAQPAAA